MRYGNVKPVARYCGMVEADALPIDTSETLTARQRVAERLILGLRTSDGVPAAWLAERAEGDPALSRRLDAWRDQGLLAETGDGGSDCCASAETAADRSTTTKAAAVNRIPCSFCH